MTTQNNIPMALVMMMRKDAVELSQNMAWSPKKKIVQEELIKMLNIWEDEKYDKEHLGEIGSLDDLEWDEDDGYNSDDCYMIHLEEEMEDPSESPYIKKAGLIARIPAGEEIPEKLRMGWF